MRESEAHSIPSTNKLSSSSSASSNSVTAAAEAKRVDVGDHDSGRSGKQTTSWRRTFARQAMVTGWSRSLGLALALIACGVTLRVVFADLPNFAPIASLALFAGMWLRSRTLAFAVPLGAMLLSDLTLAQPGYEWPLLLSVYGCLTLPVFAGPWLRRRAIQTHHAWEARQSRSSQTLTASTRQTSLGRAFGRWFGGALGISLAGGCLFFLVTNAFVWWHWYEPTWTGLTSCYANALPFLRFTLAGDLAFCVFFLTAHTLVLLTQAAPAAAQPAAHAPATES